MLEASHITKTYGKKRVLSDVSVKIEPRRFVSIIGPNGAGKSTLFSVISGLGAYEGGEVSFDGMKIEDYDRRLLAQKLSFLRQSNHLSIRLTVRELVAFGRYPYSQGRLKAEDNRIIDEAIAYLHLEELQHKFINELSGGERQRAFIAMTIAQDTAYILLDEPLNNLDMKHSVQIMKTLRHMVDEMGKTVLVVIHDINFASYYSDEIVAMKKGAVIVHDTVENVINSKTLHNIYGMEIRVKEEAGKRLCDYF